MRQIAEFVAVLACSLFAGAAVYLSLVEHPARMECGMELAATEFAPSYRRATVMQASLAAVGLVSSIAAWLAGASFLWVVAGVLLGSVIPFTLIVILPTNKQLLSPALDRRSAETERLLARWVCCMRLEVSSADWHFCCSCTWRSWQSGSDLGRARTLQRVNASGHEKKVVRRNRRTLLGSSGPYYLAATYTLIQILCESSFEHAFAPRLASPGALRPASGRRSGASLP
jgi:Domain of unknown function (DUF1772)